MNTAEYYQFMSISETRSCSFYVIYLVLNSIIVDNLEIFESVHTRAREYSHWETLRNIYLKLTAFTLIMLAFAKPLSSLSQRLLLREGFLLINAINKMSSVENTLFKGVFSFNKLFFSS